MPTSGSKMTIS